jgi:hypothetical protein
MSSQGHASVDGSSLASLRACLATAIKSVMPAALVSRPAAVALAIAVSVSGAGVAIELELLEDDEDDDAAAGLGARDGSATTAPPAVTPAAPVVTGLSLAASASPW